MKKLILKYFLKLGEYWKNYNVFSGGRIEKFKMIIFYLQLDMLIKKMYHNNPIVF